jgi:hypothetical protein
VAFDGSVSLPLCYLPTTGATGNWTFRSVDKIISDFGQCGVSIMWGSSDGFIGSLDFVKKMKRHHPGYHHVFDYVHMVKNL